MIHKSGQVAALGRIDHVLQVYPEQVGRTNALKTIEYHKITCFECYSFLPVFHIFSLGRRTAVAGRRPLRTRSPSRLPRCVPSQTVPNRGWQTYRTSSPYACGTVSVKGVSVLTPVTNLNLS